MGLLGFGLVLVGMGGFYHLGVGVVLNFYIVFCFHVLFLNYGLLVLGLMLIFHGFLCGFDGSVEGFVFGGGEEVRDVLVGEW